MTRDVSMNGLFYMGSMAGEVHSSKYHVPLTSLAAYVIALTGRHCLFTDRIKTSQHREVIIFEAKTVKRSHNMYLEIFHKLSSVDVLINFNPTFCKTDTADSCQNLVS